MKTTVTLFRLDLDVTFDESKTFEFTTSSGDIYGEAIVTEDGRLIAWEDAISAWVQLAPVASDVL